MGKTSEERMKEWVGCEVILESSLGNSRGRFLYGVRKPLARATAPLVRCGVDSTENIDGQTPRYWFVSKQHTGLKINIPPVCVRWTINYEMMEVRGEDFDFTLRRYRI